MPLTKQAQMELFTISKPQQAVPLAAYTNLIKASWILIDIIACHPQVSFLTASTQAEVRMLSTVSTLYFYNALSSSSLSYITILGAQERIFEDLEPGSQRSGIERAGESRSANMGGSDNRINPAASPGSAVFWPLESHGRRAGAISKVSR